MKPRTLLAVVVLAASAACGTDAPTAAPTPGAPSFSGGGYGSGNIAASDSAVTAESGGGYGSGN